MITFYSRLLHCGLITAVLHLQLLSVFPITLDDCECNVFASDISCIRGFYICLNKLLSLPPVSVCWFLFACVAWTRLSVWGTCMFWVRRLLLNTLYLLRKDAFSSCVPTIVISCWSSVWLSWQDSKWIEEKQFLLRTNQELHEKVHYYYCSHCITLLAS